MLGFVSLFRDRIPADRAEEIQVIVARVVEAINRYKDEYKLPSKPMVRYLQDAFPEQMVRYCTEHEFAMNEWITDPKSPIKQALDVLRTVTRKDQCWGDLLLHYAHIVSHVHDVAIYIRGFHFLLQLVRHQVDYHDAEVSIEYDQSIGILLRDAPEAMQGFIWEQIETFITHFHQSPTLDALQYYLCTAKTRTTETKEAQLKCVKKAMVQILYSSTTPLNNSIRVLMITLEHLR